VRAFRELHVESVIELSESIQNLRQVLLQEFEVPPEAADLWDVAARPKTEDAIVGKLRRSSTSLSSMQDISGARLVVPTVEIQDFVLDLVVTVMSEGGHNPRVKDTRAEGDELGYRAIHVILDWPPRRAELQLRTRMQQGWASSLNGSIRLSAPTSSTVPDRPAFRRGCIQ
jgi:ppGpp synthetase/RelA/SpoT-type nucleotidyltranferase